MAVCQNLVPLVNTKIAGKWMFIPLKVVLIGIDPYPYISLNYYFIKLCWLITQLFKDSLMVLHHIPIFGCSNHYKFREPRGWIPTFMG